MRFVLLLLGLVHKMTEKIPFMYFTLTLIRDIFDSDLLNVVCSLSSMEKYLVDIDLH